MERRPLHHPGGDAWTGAQSAAAIRATINALERRGVHLPDRVNFRVCRCRDGSLFASPQFPARPGALSLAEALRRTRCSIEGGK